MYGDEPQLRLTVYSLIGHVEKTAQIGNDLSIIVWYLLQVHEFPAVDMNYEERFPN